MQFVAAKYHKKLISTATYCCPVTENGKVQVTTWLPLTQHLIQYKVSCNNCTKVNNSFVGGEKKALCSEKDKSSIYDEKSN